MNTELASLLTPFWTYSFKLVLQCYRCKVVFLLSSKNRVLEVLSIKFDIVWYWKKINYIADASCYQTSQVTYSNDFYLFLTGKWKHLWCLVEIKVVFGLPPNSKIFALILVNQSSSNAPIIWKVVASQQFVFHGYWFFFFSFLVTFPVAKFLCW